jgi:hypothetical protein
VTSPSTSATNFGDGVAPLPAPGPAQGSIAPHHPPQPCEPFAGRRRGHRDRLRTHGPLIRGHHRPSTATRSAARTAPIPELAPVTSAHFPHQGPFAMTVT